jgi:hypothetical protein
LELVLTLPIVPRAASAPFSDRSAIVEPARFALFARSFRKVWSPTVFIVRRLRRGAALRDEVVVAVRRVAVPDFLPGAVFPAVPLLRRAPVDRRRGFVAEPLEDEAEPLEEELESP